MMLTTILTAVLLAVPVDGVATPGSASEAASNQLEAVAVEVDVTPLSPAQEPADADKTARLVLRDVMGSLQQDHGLIVRSDEGSPSIVVLLEWEDYENAVYVITVIARRPGEPERVVTKLTQECITRASLAELVIGTLPSALEALAQDTRPEDTNGAAVPQEANDGPTTGPESPGTEASNSSNEVPRRRPLGTLGKAGIGAVAGGAVLLGAGAAVFAQGDRVDVEMDHLRERVNFRPPGIALMVGGGAALVTGVALLVVDRRRERAIAPSLTLSKHRFELGISARF